MLNSSNNPREKNNPLNKPYFRVFCFAASVIASISLDQIIKHKVRLSDGFYLCNNGISFGLKLPDVHLLLLLSLFILFLGIFVNIKKNSLLFLSGFSLIASGALSNMSDRFLFGCVFDHVQFFSKILPVFNFADVMISLGTFLILLRLFQKCPPDSE